MNVMFRGCLEAKDFVFKVLDVLLKAVYFSEVGIWIKRKGILLGTEEG